MSATTHRRTFEAHYQPLYTHAFLADTIHA